MSDALQLWSDKTATPNLKTKDIVFTAGSTIAIDASADTVFGVIMDFAKYGEWNTWCPVFTFEEGPVGVGSLGTMEVNMEAQGRRYKIPEKILTLERGTKMHRTAWKGMLLPWWAGAAERVHEVTPIDEQHCQVKQWESMSGWASLVLKYAMGVPQQLEKSNAQYCTDLKKHCEALNAQSTASK